MYIVEGEDADENAQRIATCNKVTKRNAIGAGRSWFILTGFVMVIRLSEESIAVKPICLICVDVDVFSWGRIGNSLYARMGRFWVRDEHAYSTIRHAVVRLQPQSTYYLLYEVSPGCSIRTC